MQEMRARTTATCHPWPASVTKMRSPPALWTTYSGQSLLECQPRQVRGSEQSGVLRHYHCCGLCCQRLLRPRGRHLDDSLGRPAVKSSSEVHELNARSLQWQSGNIHANTFSSEAP